MGTWAFARSLGWTIAAVYFARDVGMSALELGGSSHRQSTRVS
jgi:hypothetical protein